MLNTNIKLFLNVYILKLYGSYQLQILNNFCELNIFLNLLTPSSQQVNQHN